MPEVKFKHYEVFIAADEFVYFDGRFRCREDAIGCIKNFLIANPFVEITDICCTEIGTEMDVLNVNTI